jgi:hypothetical protein
VTELVSSEGGQGPVTTFRELAAESRVESVALSHLSVELGHLYMEDFAAGPDRLDARFARVAAWMERAEGAVRRRPDQDGGQRRRVSTCFLIDDYFTQFATPAEVLPVLLEAAQRNELKIDYLARESACAEADEVPLAALIAGRLTAMPAEYDNGSRPPVLESGWLCNGRRSTENDNKEAMRQKAWTPPTEIGARNHSVFVDVQLWHDKGGIRTYSCAYLAAVWQLLRLGMIRNEGSSVVHPATLESFPERWAEMPSIAQLNADATPFCAYRTFSTLPKRFLQVEAAVHVVLNQISPQPEVLDQLVSRSAREGVEISSDLTERIEYVFFND